MTAGRPSIYSKELAEEICETISNTSKGLDDLCNEHKHWPRFGTIYKWVRDCAEFSQMYTQAKLIQASFLAEQIISISDDISQDWIEDSEGKMKFNAEHVNRSRLRVDSRKWLAAKLAPRVYGDRTFTNVDATLRQEDALKDLA